jgi:hypothetical protein
MTISKEKPTELAKKAIIGTILLATTSTKGEEAKRRLSAHAAPNAICPFQKTLSYTQQLITFTLKFKKEYIPTEHI